MTFPGVVYMGETQTVQIHVAVQSDVTALATITSGVTAAQTGTAEATGTIYNLTLTYPGVQAVQQGTTGVMSFCDVSRAQQMVCGA